jgi:hypothetical protein
LKIFKEGMTTKIWIPNNAPQYEFDHNAELALIIDWDNVLNNNETITGQNVEITPYTTGVPTLSVISSFNTSASELKFSTNSELQMYERFIVVITVETSNNEVYSRSCIVRVGRNFEK